MYDLYTVRRTQIYLDEGQDQRLSRRASLSGTTKSALIREAIDTFLDGPESDAATLHRYLAALDEVESHPLSLPEGKQYVEALRTSDSLRRAENERRFGG